MCHTTLLLLMHFVLWCCRTASYSPLLLTHAWSNKAWVQGLEGQLAGFVSAKGTKRQSLSAMPRHQREVASLFSPSCRLSC